MPRRNRNPVERYAQLVGGPRARVNYRATELIEEYGSLEAVPTAMRGSLKKAKTFSTMSEKPRRRRKK